MHQSKGGRGATHPERVGLEVPGESDLAVLALAELVQNRILVQTLATRVRIRGGGDGLGLDAE